MTLETWRILACMWMGFWFFNVVMDYFYRRSIDKTFDIHQKAHNVAKTLINELNAENNDRLKKYNDLAIKHNELIKSYNIILDAIEDGLDIKITNPKKDIDKKRILN